MNWRRRAPRQRTSSSATCECQGSLSMRLVPGVSFCQLVTILLALVGPSARKVFGSLAAATERSAADSPRFSPAQCPCQAPSGACLHLVLVWAGQLPLAPDLHRMRVQPCSHHLCGLFQYTCSRRCRAKWQHLQPSTFVQYCCSPAAGRLSTAQQSGAESATHCLPSRSLLRGVTWGIICCSDSPWCPLRALANGPQKFLTLSIMLLTCCRQSFAEWLDDVPQQLDKMQLQWLAFEGLPNMGPHL